MNKECHFLPTRQEECEKWRTNIKDCCDYTLLLVSLGRRFLLHSIKMVSSV
jgi:hypothetical protein